MSRPRIHKRTTYYLPTWQGGDRQLPLCQRTDAGWNETGERDFPLADIGVTCSCCLGIMADGLRPNAPQKRRARAPIQLGQHLSTSKAEVPSTARLHGMNP